MAIIYSKTKIKDEVIVHDDEYYYRIIRKNIVKYRKKLNITQQELADMTNVSRQYITDIESNNRNKHLTIAILGRIADAMGIDITKFFEIDAEKKNKLN